MAANVFFCFRIPHADDFLDKMGDFDIEDEKRCILLIRIAYGNFIHAYTVSE